MEATLFWIGCGLGIYAVVLRQIFKRNTWLGSKFFVSVLHILFTGAVGGLIGFVISASMDLQGPTPRWPVTGLILGLVYGLMQAVQERKPAQGLQRLLADDLEWVETSFSAILLAAVIMYGVVQAFKIPSGSMEDTLHIGDHLFVNKFIYGVRIPLTEKRVLRWRDVRRTDVVVFEAPPTTVLSAEERARPVHKDFIKRAIGLPGDEILIKDKHLYVNGQRAQEPYVVYKDPAVYPPERLALPRQEYQRLWESGRFAMLRREQIGDNFGPIRVPPGTYFVMGDNRDGSFDSRFWGPLPGRYLKGKAWLVYWPPAWLPTLRGWLATHMPSWFSRLQGPPVNGPSGVRFIY